MKNEDWLTEVEAMHDAVDAMWVRLLWGYAAFGTILLGSAGVGVPFEYAIVPSLLPIVPWFISTFRVRRATKKVNETTARRTAALRP